MLEGCSAILCYLPDQSTSAWIVVTVVQTQQPLQLTMIPEFPVMQRPVISTTTLMIVLQFEN